MTSISSLFTPQQQQLTDDKKTANSGSLAAMLGATGPNSTTRNDLVTGTPDVSYLLNLSEEARNYLATQAERASVKKDETTEAGFILNAQEQRKLDSIIASYKDEPFTQENFDAMLRELSSANLAPDQMAARDQVKQMDTTRIFLAALNGTGGGLTFSSETNASQKAKADNYLQAIYDQWESISTTASAAE